MLLQMSDFTFFVVGLARYEKLAETKNDMRCSLNEISAFIEVPSTRRPS